MYILLKVPPFICKFGAGHCEIGRQSTFCKNREKTEASEASEEFCVSEVQVNFIAKVNENNIRLESF